MKNVDLKELLEKAKSIDVSSIDQDVIVEYIQRNKELCINVGVILLAVVVSFFIYSSQMAKISSLEKEVGLIKDKVEPAKQLLTLNKKVTKYRDEFPPAMRDQEAIVFISNAADKYMMQLNSFSSVQENDKGFFKMLEMTINGTAPDYVAMANFVHDIEYSEYALRINQFDFSPNGDKDTGESDSIEVRFTLKFAILILKTEDEKNNKN